MKLLPSVSAGRYGTRMSHSDHFGIRRSTRSASALKIGELAVKANLAGALLLMGAFSAQAQHSHRGPNGGEVVDASQGPFHVEFVVRANDLELIVLDENNKPIARTGSSGRATVQSGGKTATIPLSFQEPNKLAAALPAPLARGSRVVVSGKLGDGRMFQARYVRQ